MTPKEAIPILSSLYHTDETAWLEQMAALAADGDVAALDLEHLSAGLARCVGTSVRWRGANSDPRGRRPSRSPS
jgi:hypothetical protein